MKISQVFLIAGLIVLLIGAILTFTTWNEYANYVLVAGLILMVIRGALRSREKN